MLIAYNPIFQSKKQNDYDKQPSLFAGNSGMGICLSLNTSDFQVQYVDGKAQVHLSRNLTSDECRELGKALIESANANDRNQAEWVQVCSSGAFPDPQDDTCPTCDGSGTFGGKQ